MPSKKFYWYIALLVILINLISLLPIVHSPYLGDDSWCESTLPGLLLLSKMSLPDLCWNTVKDYVHSGRWYPFIIYYYPIFCLLNEFLYKSAAVLFVLFNVGLFAYFIKITTSSSSLGLLAAMLPPLFIQFRSYHDPVMSYYFLMQVEFSLILISLIFLTSYLRSRRAIFLAFSLFAWICCLLVYEAFYAFWIMHAVVAYIQLGRGSVKRVVKITIPFFAITVLNMLVTLYIRARFVPHYQGINLNFSISDWSLAFFKQAWAAFPLSYFISDGSAGNWIQAAQTYFVTDLIIICLAWGILWCFVCDNLLERGGLENKNILKSMVLLGTGFWLLPASLVSLSAKYQQELKWGLGYLPVYVSGFGMIMLALAFVIGIYKTAQRSSRYVTTATVVAVAILGVVISGINYNSNRMVIQKYNFVEHYHRKLIENALHGSLMKFVPEGSYVMCGAPVRSWDTPSFFRMHSGLTLQVVQLSGFPPNQDLGNVSVREAFSDYLKPGYLDRYDFTTSGNVGKRFAGYRAEFVGVEGPVLRRELSSTPFNENSQVFFLKYEAKFENSGCAVLGRATQLQADNDKITGVAVDKLWIYLAIPIEYPYRTISVRGSWIDRKTLLPAGTFWLSNSNLREISKDAHGTFFEVPASTDKNYIDPMSVTAELTTTDNEPSRFSQVFTKKNLFLRN